MRLGPLDRAHRPRLREILEASAVFHQAEMAVALELFDETFDSRAQHFRYDRPSDLMPYEFLGVFTGAEELAGYACFGATPATEQTYDLYWIAVHPGAQRGGCGSRLLSEVERRLAERSGRLLVVETSSRALYAPSRRFYERRGYSAAARITGYYAPGDDRVVYIKRLSPGPSSLFPTS